MKLGFFTPYDIIVDVGTTHTVMASRHHGFALRHATCVALGTSERPGQKPRTRLVAHGLAALEAATQAGEDIKVVWPVDHGHVTHPVGLDFLLKAMQREGMGRPLWPMRGRGAIVVPPHYPVEDRLRLIEQTQTLARGPVKVIEMPWAAARGLGLPMDRPEGHMMIELGAGHMAMAAISMGGLVTTHVMPYGGVDLDQAIVNYVERRYQAAISLESANEIKHTLGSVHPLPRPDHITVAAKQSKTQRDKRVQLHDNEIRDVLLDAFEPLVMSIQAGFENISPELCGDIAHNGVMLMGGGALLAGMAPFLTERLGFPCMVADDPMDVIWKGAHQLLLEGNLPDDE